MASDVHDDSKAPAAGGSKAAASVGTLIAFEIIFTAAGYPAANSIGGVDGGRAWLAASVVCSVVGVAGLAVSMRFLPLDARKMIVVGAALPLGRIVLTLVAGRVVAGCLPRALQPAYWISLAAAYLFTLAAETALLVRMLARKPVGPAAAGSVH